MTLNGSNTISLKTCFKKILILMLFYTVVATLDQKTSSRDFTSCVLNLTPENLELPATIEVNTEEVPSSPVALIPTPHEMEGGQGSTEQLISRKRIYTLKEKILYSAGFVFYILLIVLLIYLIAIGWDRMAFHLVMLIVFLFGLVGDLFLKFLFN